jgi:hypothetical protein
MTKIPAAAGEREAELYDRVLPGSVPRQQRQPQQQSHLPRRQLLLPEFRGSRPEGLEMLAVATRILDAEGSWIDASADLLVFFALSGLHSRQSNLPGDAEPAAPSPRPKWRRWISSRRG